MKVLDTYNAIIGAVIAVFSYIFGEIICPIPGIQCC